MIRRDFLQAAFGPCLLFGLIGCGPDLMRGKTDDETDRERYDIRVIRDVATIGNAEPLHLGGVGLVTGLDGTGGDCPNNSYRNLLEDQLRKAGNHNVKEILSSPGNAMVVVTAQVPPGTREGEAFDIEVSLPPGSKATSLRGGVLQHCKLFTYAQASRLRSDLNGSSELVLGHAVASAEGPLLAGMGIDKDADESRLKKARIWNGGHSKITASLRIVLNSDKQQASLAGLIANRLNETYHGAFGPGSKMEVAVAHDNVGIDLNVPPRYRYNLPHFLRVVLATPLHVPGDTVGEGAGYKQRLAADLLDPNRTVSAALRLEALGDSSATALKAGLKSDNVKVRFSAAEALAYLGNSAGVDELGTIIVQQPFLRAYGLTALASLNHKAGNAKLRDILTGPLNNDEVRYGAFRALRTVDDRDEAVAGILLNDAFWLHHVAPRAEPFIHISSTKRPEIVIFGGAAKLAVPFGLRAGDFCVTATENDVDHCLVSYVALHAGTPERRECPLTVDDVLRTLAEMGASYPEALEILQQADLSKCLSSRLRADALPQVISVEELNEMGRKKVGGEAASNEELGATPGLFDNPRPAKESPFIDGAPIRPEAKASSVLGSD